MSFFTEKQRFAFSNLVLAAFVGCVLYSGFAYPLNYGQGLWPWSRDWFMFSSDDGYDFYLEASGENLDGESITIDPSVVFSFPIGAKSNRFQEAPRDQESMNKLADYLCAHLPLRTITLREMYWPRSPGKRLSHSEVPKAKIKESFWAEKKPCRS